YAVCAAVQGAMVRSVPLQGGHFMPDLDSVRAAVETAPTESPIKIVFACTPKNHTGGAVPRGELLQHARGLQGRALLVVDEAYVEFSDDGSLAGDVASNENLVVLRTLSKVHGLAAARVGCMIAAPEIVAFLRRIMPPYPVPTPCSDAAERALSPESLQRTRQRVETVMRERDWMRERLSRHPAVREVLPSQANFLCVRFDDAGARFAQLLGAGVVVRALRRQPGLDDALRISIGTSRENDTLLATLNANATCAA
ncbi:MAG: histidinol-phosphate aminotransferase, partial [Xanthomonadaceae bacterium]|nr:histidinol-phosphate aminotransferase [Xanthomonadaceae bacterium]